MLLKTTSTATPTKSTIPQKTKIGNEALSEYLTSGFKALNDAKTALKKISK
jgi:hypothetical protein